jgi:hypothetical protein
LAVKARDVDISPVLEKQAHFGLEKSKIERYNTNYIALLDIPIQKVTVASATCVPQRRAAVRIHSVHIGPVLEKEAESGLPYSTCALVPMTEHNARETAPSEA